MVAKYWWQYCEPVLRRCNAVFWSRIIDENENAEKEKRRLYGGSVEPSLNRCSVRPKTTMNIISLLSRLGVLKKNAPNLSTNVVRNCHKPYYSTLFVLKWKFEKEV